MMATTAKYVRLSSEDDDLRQGGKLESNSIANQRDLLDAFISRMPERQEPISLSSAMMAGAAKTLSGPPSRR